MNREAICLSHILFLVICACCHLSSAAPDGGWDTLNKRKGAEAKICVTVVDPDGKPIGGVPVKGYFYLYTRGEVNKDIVLTDADGRADVKGMCSSYNAAIELQQDGYYATGDRIDMLGNDYPGDGIVGVKKDKWIPYGLQRKYVFKQIRNPVPMVVFNDSTFEAGLDMDYGYDLEYGSFVEPYGDGKVVDFNVRYTRKIQERKDGKGEDIVITATIHFFRELDGAYFFPIDSSCRFQSPYHANPEAKYEKDFIAESLWLKQKNGVIGLVRHTKMYPEKQGMIFRTRSVVSSDGTLVSAHYGKIYGEISVFRNNRDFSELGIGCWTEGLATFFNPVANDTNLECDGKWHPKLRKGKRMNDDNGVNGAL